MLQDLAYTSASMWLIMLDAGDTSLGEELQRAVDRVRRAAQGLREAVNDLRLADETDLPFPDLVESLVTRNWAMARGLEISLDVGEGFPRPRWEMSARAAWILQEALTNARRHPGRGSVSVTLETEGVIWSPRSRTTGGDSSQARHPGWA